MKRLHQATLRKALSEPNAKLEAARAQDTKLATEIRRAQRAKTGGKTGALLGAVVSLLLGVAAAAGASVAPVLVIALLLAVVSGLVAVGAAARVPKLEREREQLATSLEGRYLQTERRLAKVDARRQQSAASLQRLERKINAMVGAGASEARELRSKARQRQMDRVKELDALQSRYQDLLERLNRASIVEQVEGRMADLEAKKELAAAAMELETDQDRLRIEIDELETEFEAHQEVEQLLRSKLPR